MSAPSATAGFLGIILAAAKESGNEMNAMIAMRGGVAAVRAQMFEGVEQTVFLAIEELLNRDEPPTAHPVVTLSGVTYEVLSGLLRFEKMFGTISQGAEAVERNFIQRRTTERLTQALAASQKGDVEAARTLAGSLSFEGASRASYAVSSLETYVFDPAADPRLPTPHSRLNDALGGGLGYGGRNALSLWVASSGVGKSAFWHGMIPHFLQQGLILPYYSGEADENEVITEMARIMSDTTHAQMLAVRGGKLPIIRQRIEIAVTNLKAYPGFFKVIDEFDAATVRATLRDYAFEAERRRAAGEPNVQVIGVVDNVDHAIGATLDRGLTEEQLYNNQGREFLLAARRDHYHLAMLSQTNQKGRERNGGPEIEDVARAKALTNHVGQQVSLYRPLTDDDRSKTMPGKNGDALPGPRAKHLVSILKARGGRPEVLEFGSKPDTGRWFDPKEPAF